MSIVTEGMKKTHGPIPEINTGTDFLISQRVPFHVTHKDILKLYF